jgi:hypothetical protein
MKSFQEPLASRIVAALSIALGAFAMDGSATRASRQIYALLAIDYQAFGNERQKRIDRREKPGYHLTRQTGGF